MTTAGRPTLYKPDYDDQAHNHCLLGATNAGLADLFDVGQRTIDRWIADIPSFAKAVRDGRAIADGRVARSLYERAVGYQHTVERILFHRGEEKRITSTVQHPPDTQACIFWLRNRQRDLWSGNQQRRDDVNDYDDIAALEAAGEWARQQPDK